MHQLKKSQEKLKKHFELSKNENTTYRNLWKAVLRGKIIVLNAYIRKN